MKRLALIAFLCCCPAFAVTMVIQTNPKPAWAPSQPWKTGATNGLDGTASTGNTGYTWSCTSYDPGTGATTCPLVFSNVNASQPTVTGVVTGYYVIQLCDGAGMNCVSSDTTVTPISAVDFDATTGIINTHNTAADKIFGPMQALGQGGWGFMDWRNFVALGLQNTYLGTPYPYATSYSDLNPMWTTDLAGTGAYHFNGTGNNEGDACTTLASNLANTDTDVVVSSTACLDLSEFPTRIMVTANSFTYEEIRICSNTGTTLHICYNGRGVPGGPSGTLGPTSFVTATAKVGQQIIKGTGSSWLSTFCPGGAGGQIGPIAYSTGTVDVTAGSPTVTAHSGSGITWTGDNINTSPGNVYAGYVMQISGTHGGGTPFVFVGYISSFGSTTSATLASNYPSDADTGTFSYKIIVPWFRYIVTHFTRGTPYSGDALGNWVGTGCESDTEIFFNFAIAGSGPKASATLQGTNWPSSGISWQDNDEGYNNNIGFYGVALAARAYWYRTGNILALQIANALDDNYIRFPQWMGGNIEGVGDYLFNGGGVISAWTSYAIRGTPDPANMRPTANGISLGSCNFTDPREHGYAEAATNLGAIYDPDTMGWRATLRSLMQSIYTYDVGCQTPSGTSGIFTNSFATGAYWNNGSGVNISLTNGSAAGTGTGIPSSVCTGVETGTVTVTAGSAAVTATSGTFSTSANAIVIQGRHFGFERLTSTTGNLAVLWPGSNGSQSYMTSNENLLSGTPNSSIGFATSVLQNDDPALNTNYICLWNSSSSITLDKNFASTTGTYIPYLFNLTGRNVQPFMLGIQGWSQFQGAPLDSTLSINNTQLVADTAAWQYANGYDTSGNANNIYYARGASFAESGGTQTGSFQWATPTSRGGLQGSPNYPVVLNRELNQEGFNILVHAYMLDASAPKKAAIDCLYDALWGSTTLNSGPAGSCTDSNSLGNTAGQGYFNLGNGAQALGGGKYYAQYYGMGMAHLWPALRLCTPVGGVIPVDSNGVIQCLATGTGGSVSGGNQVIGVNAVRFLREPDSAKW